MNFEVWDEFYRKSIYAGFSEIEKTNGILLGFNANVDAIKPVNEELLHVLTAEESNVDITQIPKNKIIRTPHDLLVGLLHCMKNGVGEEWQITNPNVYTWLSETLSPEAFAIGGQSGIMANVSSRLGVKNIILNAPVVPIMLAKLLEKGVLIPKLINNELRLLNPHEIAIDSKELVHWIFEFRKGFKVVINDRSFVVPESRRFIATYDPINSEVTIDPGFVEAGKKYAKKVKGAVLGGHHLLKPNNPSDYYIKKAKFTKNIIEMWKSVNQDFLVKYEAGYFSSTIIADIIKQIIFSSVDIIGINEQELYQMVKLPSLSPNITYQERAMLLLKSLIKLSELGKPRIGIHFHSMTLDMFYLINSDILIKNEDFDALRNSLSLAALLTSVTAFLGNIPSKKDLLTYAKNHENPLYYTDLSKKIVNSISEYVERYGGKKEDIETLGYTSFMNGVLFVIPIKYVPHPIKSVGLGDTCSVTQFLSYPM